MSINPPRNSVSNAVSHGLLHIRFATVTGNLNFLGVNIFTDSAPGDKGHFTFKRMVRRVLRATNVTRFLSAKINVLQSLELYHGVNFLIPNDIVFEFVTFNGFLQFVAYDVYGVISFRRFIS